MGMHAPAWSVPQALGAEVQVDRTCMFCGTPLANRGLAYMEHIEDRPGCRVAYAAWLERLDEDRPGG